MNEANFQQAGGFPLETDTLDFLQKSYKDLHALTAFGGDNIIVSGCVVTGVNVSNGFVVINGELLPFKGGLAQPKVIVRSEVSTGEFENGSVKDVYTIRHAAFGSSEPNILFADLTRIADMKILSGLIDRVNKLERFAVPFTVDGGTMLFWRKPANQIPAGWREVLDWRGRIPLGLNPDDPEFAVLGAPGGSKTHQNTLEEMVPHDHDVTVNDPSGGLDYGNGSTRNSNTNSNPVIKKTSKTGGVGGVAKVYSIMNPYRIVDFIEPIPKEEE